MQNKYIFTKFTCLVILCSSQYKSPHPTDQGIAVICFANNLVYQYGDKKLLIPS